MAQTITSGFENLREGVERVWRQMVKEYAEPRGTVEETERYTTQHIVQSEHIVICVFNRTHLAQADAWERV